MACSSCGYNPCTCSTPTYQFNWNTIPDESCDPCSTDKVCKQTFPGYCVFYEGPALTCFGLGTHVSYDLIIATLHSLLCSILNSSLCNAPQDLAVDHS